MHWSRVCGRLPFGRFGRLFTNDVGIALAVSLRSPLVGYVDAEPASLLKRHRRHGGSAGRAMIGGPRGHRPGRGRRASRLASGVRPLLPPHARRLRAHAALGSRAPAVGHDRGTRHPCGDRGAVPVPAFGAGAGRGSRHGLQHRAGARGLDPRHTDRYMRQPRLPIMRPTCHFFSAVVLGFGGSGRGTTAHVRRLQPHGEPSTRTHLVRSVSAASFHSRRALHSDNLPSLGVGSAAGAVRVRGRHYGGSPFAMAFPYGAQKLRYLLT